MTFPVISVLYSLNIRDHVKVGPHLQEAKFPGPSAEQNQ